MSEQYIEQRDGGYWVAETRVSLDSIVYAFREGLSPETIVKDCFPSLTLEQVYGAVTYYLHHRAEIDAYLEREAAEYEAARKVARESDQEFCDKLSKAREQIQLPSS
jgi:uncharacterized protein (DUF433 family)